MVTIYLFENIIQYKEKEEIKEYSMPTNAMKYGKIINIPIFESAFNKLAKKEKWICWYKSKSMTIILPVHYEETDKEVLTVVLNNIGIKKITYKKEINILNIKNNQKILNIHENYVTTIEQKKGNKKIYFYPTNIFLNTESLISFILKNDKSKYRYYILGSKKNISKVVETINKTNIYYYKKSRTQIIEKIYT